MLESLDQKIELNRKINANLEAIAQAIFKSWFVDFDPVHAKAEGRQPVGMDAKTAALFPSEFVDSELGKIPKGWEVNDLNREIEILNGFAFKSEDYVKEGTFVLRTKNFTTDHYVNRLKGDVFLPESFHSSHEKYLSLPYDYHLVMVGASIGKRGLIFPHQLPALRNQNMWCFRTKNSSFLSQYFVKYQLDAIVVSRMGLASGSAREFFRKGNFGEAIICIGTKKLQHKLNLLLSPIVTKISLINAESDNLKLIRDALLPKLLSGAIKI